jgi:hypothetical protein
MNFNKYTIQTNFAISADASNLEDGAPKSAIANTAEEVRERVYMSQKQIVDGQYDTQETYKQRIDTFFKAHSDDR